MDDRELIAAYVRDGSNTAFGELVRRHIAWVYSIANRQVGNAALAEDVAQSVFVLLARKAGSLQSQTVLAGWLFRTTRFVANRALRAERRRRLREQTAARMIQTITTPHINEAGWDKLEPQIDEAVANLSESDRLAILLRFYEKKSLVEVGGHLGVSEEAAKKRVSRAIERMRTFLIRRGVPGGAAVLTKILGEHTVQSVPHGLTSSVLKTIAKPLPSSGNLPPLVKETLAAWRWAKLKILGGVTGSLCAIAWLLLGLPPAAEHVQPATVRGDEPSARLDSEAAAPPNWPHTSSPAGIEQLPKFDPITTRTIVTVLDSENDQPIAHAHLRTAYFYDGGVGEGHHSVTRNDGAAPVPFPKRDGTWGANLFVTAAGYVPKSMQWRNENFPETYTINLDPALTFAGWVVDEEGRPVSDARITIECSTFEYNFRKRENVAFNSQDVIAVSHANGWFSLPYIPRQVPPHSYLPPVVTLNVNAEGFALTQTNFSGPLIARSDLKLVIRKGATVTGHIYDSSGRPVGNALVRERHNWGWRRLTTRSEADGHYTLEGLWDPRGPEVKLVVQAEGFGSQQQLVHLDATTNHLDFILKESPVFRGRVIDEHGVPLAEVTVRTDVESSEDGTKYEWLDITNVDGRFEWNSAPVESTMFWFEKSGYETIRMMPFVPNGADYEIILRRIGSTKQVKQQIPTYNFRFYEPKP
jgi:RNA polymerase sigma factor (sigma-70 family)